ncbi:MAG: hypothetical protein RL296_1317 [Actinomycetota bacterium]
MIKRRFANDPMVWNNAAFAQRVSSLAKLANRAVCSAGYNNERVSQEAAFLTAKRTQRGAWR